MKQRRTYLVNDPDSFTPKQLEVKDGSLSLNGLHAVEERRITFSLDELPTEVRQPIVPIHSSQSALADIL
jgi:hypothetical protein